MSDRPDPCPTCSGPIRETVGMVCQTPGTDYAQMSDRDELIEQAARTVGLPPGATATSDIEDLITAGWRPPPSGDVIEQAAQTLHSYEVCDVWDDPDAPSCNGNCHRVAVMFADAGVLAAPHTLAVPADWREQIRDVADVDGQIHLLESWIVGGTHE